MNEQYCIYLGSEAVGTVKVSRTGLYYRMNCCCNIEAQSMFDLFVSCGKSHRKLGICIPKDGCLCLDTKVPVKEFEGESMQFYLKLRNPKKTEKVLPVDPKEPFEYLEKLEDAYLSEENGILGLAFKESTQEQPDSDQIQ